MQAAQRHLTIVIESVDAKISDHARRSAAAPPLRRTSFCSCDGAAEVSRRCAKVELLYKAARALAHDHQDLFGVDRDLACAARSREAGLRCGVVANHRRVQVAEAIDLRSAEEAHIDAAPLQVEAKEVVHGDGGGGAGHDRWVAD